MYSGTYWILINSDVNSTYYNTSVYCGTAAATAAKAGTVSYHTAATAGKYFQVMMIYDNSAQSALTFSVGGSGDKPLYINGTVSSSTNYTLPKGLYFVYYDGTNFYFRTDNKITGNITGNAETITQKYTANTVTSAEYRVLFTDASGTSGTTNVSSSARISNSLYFNPNTGRLTATTVANAIWNDYAEYRTTLQGVKPGQVVADKDDGSLYITNKRLVAGAQIVSDTWGHIMGETETAKTPLAVSGRVLAYTYQPREKYHAGDVVCSAPNGTVDIMTREEIKEYPDAIIGIVSEIPNYESWGTGNVPINGRIWIKVR